MLEIMSTKAPVAKKTRAGQLIERAPLSVKHKFPDDVEVTEADIQAFGDGVDRAAKGFRKNKAKYAAMGAKYAAKYEAREEASKEA